MGLCMYRSLSVQSEQYVKMRWVNIFIWDKFAVGDDAMIFFLIGPRQVFNRFRSVYRVVFF